MRNNKGFTLMELIAALFIGGMVTAALVLVWKTASLQTSQSQSQTIINNKVSNYTRQLYKDIKSTDIILTPTSVSSSTATILSGLKQARKLDSSKFITTKSPGDPAIFFTYCTEKDEEPEKILRYETTLASGSYEFSSYSGNSYLVACRREGKAVLNDVGGVRDVTCGSNDGFASASGDIKCKIIINRTFTPASGLTPIVINRDIYTSLPGGGDL